MAENIQTNSQAVEDSVSATDGDWLEDREPITQELKDLQKLVRSLYEAGEPLFTKDRIRAAIPLRETCRNNPTEHQEFYMDGYHGKQVKVFVFRDEPERDSPELRMLWSRPIIDYSSIERMLTEETVYDETFTVPVRVTRGSAWINASQDDDAEIIEWTTPDALTDHFKKVQNEWLDSEYYAAFKEVLISAKLATGIDKVFGYALGSCYSFGKVWGKRSLLQHAIILLSRDILSSNNNRGEVKCFLQDPDYDPEEKKMHEELGMTVVDDPDGFLLVDNDSLVVSIAPDVPVKQIVLDLCLPAAIIWMAHDQQNERTEIQRSRMTDPDSTRVQGILREQYTAIKLPDGEAATDLYLYVRKP